MKMKWSRKNSERKGVRDEIKLPLNFSGWFQLGSLNGLVNEKRLKQAKLKLLCPLLISLSYFIKIGPKMAKLFGVVLGRVVG